MSTTRRIDIGLYGQDRDVKSKVDSLKLNIAGLKDAAKNIGLGLNDEEAKVKLLDFNLKLDRLDDRVSKPSISLRGADRVLLDMAKIDLGLDALGKKSETVSVGVSTSLFSRLKNILSGSRSSKGFNPSALLSGEAASGAGGLPELASPAGVGILGGLGSLVAAMIPGLAGGATALGAGGVGLAGDYKENPGQFKGLTAGIHDAMTKAFSGLGQIVKPIMDQMGSFIKSLGKPLNDLFKASIPLVGQFLKGLEPAVRTVLPILTSEMKQLGPTIKILAQAFGNLLVAAAKTIQFMGPGFKASAEVIRGAVNIIDSGLENLGKLFGFLAQAWQKTASLISDVVHGDFSKAFSDGKSLVSLFVHGIYNLFGVLDHDVESIFNSIERNMILGVSRGVIAAESWFRRLPSLAVSALSSLPGRLYSIGRNAILSLVSGLRSDIGGVTSLIGSLASEVTGIHLPSFHFANGGWITEPIAGVGLTSGAHYSLAEYGPEYVSPHGAMSGGGDVYNFTVNGFVGNEAQLGLKIQQVLRRTKRQHGNPSLGF